MNYKSLPSNVHQKMTEKIGELCELKTGIADDKLVVRQQFIPEIVGACIIEDRATSLLPLYSTVSQFPAQRFLQLWADREIEIQSYKDRKAAIATNEEEMVTLLGEDVEDFPMCLFPTGTGIVITPNDLEAMKKASKFVTSDPTRKQ